MNGEVTLDREEFDALRSLALQFLEISSSHLEKIGVAGDEARVAWELVRDSHALGDGVAGLRLRTSTEGSQPAPFVVHGGEVIVELAKWQRVVICRLASRVLVGFGERELFYRTGFSLPELRHVAAKVCI
jgi:hypothetical protein